MITYVHTCTHTCTYLYTHTHKYFKSRGWVSHVPSLHADCEGRNEIAPAMHDVIKAGCLKWPAVLDRAQKVHNPKPLTNTHAHPQGQVPLPIAYKNCIVHCRLYRPLLVILSLPRRRFAFNTMSLFLEPSFCGQTALWQTSNASCITLEE